MRYVFVLALFLSIPANVLPATIYVPDDYATIQAAITAAMDGDVVIVRAGTYVENIDFMGKAITVESEDGPSLTVIDGNDADTVVTFQNSEGADSVLDGFTITNGTALSAAGGGILCDGASPTIMNNYICDNEAIQGGGIGCIQNASPIIMENNIYSNDGSVGGGIICYESSPTISNNQINANNANTHGGGIYCYIKAFPVIKDNTFANQTAVYGAGISVIGASAPVISQNGFYQNDSSSYGGGIFISDDSAPEIMENELISNSAKRGGGIYCYGSYPVISGNSIEANYASNDGGGIYCLTESYSVITNNYIYANMASSDGGGICCDHNDESTVTNNTIYENTATGNGGGLYCDNDAAPVITNTIFWNNSASSGSEIYDGTGYAIITYCCVEGWYPGTGNFDAPPHFVDPGNEDFHLTYLSSCRGAGDDSAPSLPDTDSEGDPRIAYGNADVGADEFHTHLYFTGNTLPGASIELYFVDLPGSSPVGLWIATDALETPIPGAYGDWYLLPPMVGPFLLGSIPTDGVYVLPGTIPLVPSGPYSLYLQAAIGTPPNLTNLCTLNVL